jgi:uncharacterized repeat protein (TIGR03803 family)
MFHTHDFFRKCTRLASIGLLLPAVCALAGAAPAQATESTLFQFSGNAGSIPMSKLIFDANGALYGTTQSGGTGGFGTVFKLTPPASRTGPWTETVLYGFTGGADGANPSANVVFDAQGALYGTAPAGGTNGEGVAFKLTPPASGSGPWTETVLYNFGATTTDCTTPSSGLIFNAGGHLFGTTVVGGAQHFGCVFRLNAPVSGNGPWTETILYSFQSPTSSMAEGYNPSGNVVFDAKGALYGTTLSGGEQGAGTVYQLTPVIGGWTKTTLYAFRFGAATDGERPSGLTFDKNGAIYGATYSGGKLGTFGHGIIYKLTPPVIPGGKWTEQILFMFDGTFASSPVGPLILDAQGSLYGVTESEGSTGKSNGSVFRLSPPASGSGGWTRTTLHNFADCSNPSGCRPAAGLKWDANGALYGTTSASGPGQLTAGAVYRLVCNQWSGTGAGRVCLSW